MTVKLSTLGPKIKELYEANTNTNAFTDTEKTKLAGLDANAAPQNVFIQSSQPVHTGAYVWFNTSGGNLQIMVEDGL